MRQTNKNAFFTLTLKLNFELTESFTQPNIRVDFSYKTENHDEIAFAQKLVRVWGHIYI